MYFNGSSLENIFSDLHQKSLATTAIYTLQIYSDKATRFDSFNGGLSLSLKIATFLIFRGVLCR